MVRWVPVFFCPMALTCVAPTCVRSVGVHMAFQLSRSDSKPAGFTNLINGTPLDSPLRIRLGPEHIQLNHYFQSRGYHRRTSSSLIRQVGLLIFDIRVVIALSGCGRRYAGNIAICWKIDRKVAFICRGTQEHFEDFHLVCCNRMIQLQAVCDKHDGDDATQHRQQQRHADTSEHKDGPCSKWSFDNQAAVKISAVLDKSDQEHHQDGVKEDERCFE